MNDIVADHDRLRSLMFSIAYRMLGSVAEAEDIAQEALFRMHRRPATINSIEAYAATVTTRLAIDHLRAARVRRERYVGTWLPEPLVASGTDLDPAAHIEAADTLSIAFFVVLERLSPIERAVFLLREVFAYEYSDIATIVGKTASNCRQILTRAKARLLQPSRRFEVAPARRETLAQQFFAACHDGDLGGLERILAEDVAFYADGGGKAPAVLKPVTGRVRVARFLLGLLRQASTACLRIEQVRVNGGPGARVYNDRGTLVAVLALHIVDQHVQAVYNMMNPDKLQHLAAASREPSFSDLSA